MKVFNTMLDAKTRIRLSAPNDRTAAARKADNDCRNAVRHAAGYGAMLTLDNGKIMEPWRRSCLDFTGVGVTLRSANDMKTYHPVDSTQPAARESRGSALKTNMKLVRLSLVLLPQLVSSLCVIFAALAGTYDFISACLSAYLSLCAP